MVAERRLRMRIINAAVTGLLCKPLLSTAATAADTALESSGRRANQPFEGPDTTWPRQDDGKAPDTSALGCGDECKGRKGEDDARHRDTSEEVELEASCLCVYAVRSRLVGR